MSDLGNLYFNVMLRDMTDADIEKIKKKLEKAGVKVGAEVNRQTLERSIRDMLKHKTFDVRVDVSKNAKKASVEANKSILTKSVNDALKGHVFTADLKLNIKTATVQDAIRQAFAQAGMQYSTSASDVRAQRIAEIQQRMAIRAANAQRNLGNAYRYAAGGASESAKASVVLGRSLHSNIRLAGELGTAMGNFASVFGIKDLLQNMVQIGGQLENQKIALGAILQDGGKATEMFSKIQSLAVKSPFGIMDLNQYTKQLSAYSIPYNELYETMKRLADISAGVGVDMGRIVLAFGQVRAAGFLKGTELRQFTEANIPMVEKLAERFSMLEKRIVSAGEVYDMISKKKISFEDVKAVLWELTGEGGMFNNMQEVLSESLASKWKNLADAIDVMYGKISEGWVGGGLKLLAEGLTELTKNWEYLVTAITSATAAYIAYKTSVAIGSGSNATGVWNMIKANKALEVSNLMVAKTYRELGTLEKAKLATAGQVSIVELRQAASSGVLTKEMTLRLLAMKKITKEQAELLAGTLRLTQAEINQAAATSRASVAWARLSGALTRASLALKAMFLNPWTWVFAGITAIGEFFTYYSNKQDEIEERNKNFAESAKGSAETLERELLKLKDLDISKMNTDEMKIKVKELTSVIQNEADGWQSILSEIFAKEADGTFKNSVEKQLKLLKTKMDELAEAKKKLMGEDETYSDVIGATESGFLWWEKDVLDKIKDYNEAVEKNDKTLKRLGIHARDVSEALQYAINGNKVLSEELAGKSLNQQVALLSEYSNEWQKFVGKLSDINPKARSIASIWKANIPSRKEIEDAFKKAKAEMDNVFALRGEDINNFTEFGKQTVLGFAEGIITETSTQRPKMKQWIYDWWTGMYNLPRNDLDYVVPSDITNVGNGGAGSKKDAVAEMWKRRASEIEKAVKMYDQWKKIEGKLMAENRVRYNEELSNLFNGAYGFKLDLENPTEAYEYIKGVLDESKEKQKELKVELGVKISDAELKDAQDELKQFLENTKTYIDKTVKGWDLYKKLFDATGNSELSMNIAFGGNVSFKNKLEELKDKILETMDSLGIGLSFDELIKFDTKKLEDAGWTGVSELIKAYNEESRKFKQESIDNFIDIIKASKDFGQQIADIQRKLQKDLKDLRDNAVDKGMGNEELKRREDELTRKANEDISSVRFEEFKKSSDWVKVFDDLDRVSNDTLDNMSSSIEEYARNASLSEEVTKQLVEAMRKLREETIERNPFESFSDAWDRLKNVKDAFKRGKQGDGFYYLKQANGMFKAVTEQQLNDEQREVNDDLLKSTTNIINKFNAISDAAQLLTPVLRGLGVNVESLTASINNIVGGATTGGSVASAFGATGPWGAIIGAGIGMISAAFASRDNSLQRQIEASQSREKALENIAKNIQTALERTMGGAYSFSLDEESKKSMENLVSAVWVLDVLGNEVKTDKNKYSEETRKKAQEAIDENSYFDAQWASMLATREELQEQLEYEESKKNANEDKIEDYKQSLKDIDIQISDLAKDIAEELYGIDFKGWADQLAETLVSAWENGEDAAQAYKNKVNEILRDVGVSIISQKILQPLLNDTMEKFLAQFEKDNGVITDESMLILAEIANGAEQATKATEAYLEGLKKLGIDISAKGNEASDGLSKGIQSVTEDTANLLGSYLNAMRQDVSVKRTLLEQLVGSDVPKMNYLAEAQLQQLQMVVANTKRNADTADKIYSLIDRVVDKGGNRLKI